MIWSRDSYLGMAFRLLTFIKEGKGMLKYNQELVALEADICDEYCPL